MIILANKKGYLMLAQTKTSRFQGSAFQEKGRVWKAVESLEHGKAKDATNSLFAVEREYATGTETYFLDGQGFMHECEQERTLVLDCRKMDDYGDWGREFQFQHEQGSLVITYTKKNSPTEKGQEYTIYVAVFAKPLRYLPVKQWKEHHYDFDEERHSRPSTRWVFEAIKLKDSASIAYGLDKKKVIAHARTIYQDYVKRKQAMEKHVMNVIRPATTVAEQCARASLDAMCVTKGIRAGIPWFMETWSRDELVSCKTLPDKTKRDILGKYTTLPIPANPRNTLVAADAPGWLFLRWQDIKGPMSAAETKKVRNMIQAYLNTVQWDKGLVFTESKQTWMDSLDRENCNLEIQALTLAACKVSRELGMPLPQETKLKERVRAELWNHKWLLDGRDDETIRPNVFIAAYAYPELLNKREWTTCFTHALNALWLDWGGLSTIDKRDARFVDTHTGEDPRSYHSGDSWYWMNNLAAIVLHKHGGFDEYVRAIRSASETEITTMGAVGHHAELSSAKKQTSQGCPAQAWSAATFIELCETMR